MISRGPSLYLKLEEIGIDVMAEMLGATLSDHAGRRTLCKPTQTTLVTNGVAAAGGIQPARATALCFLLFSLYEREKTISQAFVGKLYPLWEN